MLYIFHVDTGTMLTFDMNLAMDTVANLQRVIAKACRIQEDKQVLLISGGESLDPQAMVGSYSAGTDTNPIFLFSKSTIEAATPPSPSVHYGSDIDLQEQVEGSLIMPPTYETVVSRAQLALQFHDVDKEELRACEKLVHDQHLQQQGWAAVVANLEDITSALRHRSDVFQDSYSEYLLVREHFITLLGKIPEVLTLLSKIPVLQPLQCVTSHAVPEETDSGEELLPQTLYLWINSQDPQNRLEDMATQCLKFTEQFDDKISEMLKGEVTQTFEAVTNQNMKEVKGLEDRLYGLDQIMSGAKRLVQEQAEMSQGFVQNQNRAGNLRDNSVLPDLCASHKKQLLVMLNNHRKLREIKKKCRMAKEELSVNLHTRLRWVMFVEKKLCDVDGKLMIYNENLKRLRKRLDILQQIHDAPLVYAQLVVEVVRRRNFSSNFIQWASNLAEESALIHSDEVKRRESFLMEVGQHFLQALFHGFEDIPPTFATKSPESFDQRLPNITSSDLDTLQKAVPELSGRFSLSKEIETELEQRLSALGPKPGPSHVSLADSVSPGRNGSKSRQLTPLCQSHNTCTSDIDILQESSNGHFSPIECEEISFDGHICAPGTEPSLTNQAISPPDNLGFLMPESLSTKLTAEMKTQASLATRETTLVESVEDSVQGLSDSLPGEKSSDDSTASRKIIISTAVASDTSPEGETSQDFATADFYIDESMPSSIEHMSASKSLEKSELSKQLQEKCANVAKLEEEVKDTHGKLTSSETKIKTLQELVQKEMEKLRTDLVDIKDNFFKEKNQCMEIITDFSNRFSEVLSVYDAKLREIHSEELNTLQSEFQEKISDLQDEVLVAHRDVESLQVELKTIKEQWASTKADSEAVRISLETKIKELSESYETERDEMIRNHSLELEVELDKVRDEFQQEIIAKDLTLKEKDDEVAGLQEQILILTSEKEKIFEDLTQKFQMEKDDLVLALEKDHAEKRDRAIEEALDERGQIHEDSLLELKLEFDEKEKSKQLEFDKEIEDLKINLSEEKRAELEQLRNNLDKEHCEKLTSLEEKLRCEHEKQVEEKLIQLTCEKDLMKVELEKLTKESAPVSERESMSRDKHEQVVTDIQTNFEQTLNLAIQEAVKECEAKHKEELSAIRSTLEQDSVDKLSALRANVTAEKQVLFNEAVSKLTNEKEKLIEELRAREASLLEQQQKDKVLMEQLIEEKTRRQNEIQLMEEKTKAMKGHQHQVEDDLALSRKQLDLYRQQLHSMSSVSVMSSASDISVLPLEGSMMRSTRIQELEGALKTKEDEIFKLNKKVMELSMTASTRNVTQDKVSITSCSIGDIVLLCLDERHDQYVVFTVGTTLHFLHSDCLQTLGLKTNPGEARKSWVLAQILDKEYCQAKKPQNRFRVPVGTKFYRVKAKPWSRESPRRTALSGTLEGAGL